MYSVQAYFKSFGNHKREIVVGQVRRLADELGKFGIIGKRGQTNKRVFKKGYLRIVWPNREMAIRYQQLVEEFWGHVVTTKRFKIG